MIGAIAKTELQTLFYSPIAWLVLVIVAVQAGMGFMGNFISIVEYQGQGYNNTGFSLRLLGERGLFGMLKGNMYLYIPLLTMGLLTRELSSGSIKLLYAAPVNNAQIVLGKYIAMLVFCFVLICIPVIYIFFTGFTVEHFEWGAVWSGLLGLYLLMCTYAAVGLFMSSITSYQIVAVICTVTLLGVLQAVGTMWQDVLFVQEITYWLSISSRTDELFKGLICSEDVLYFIIVSALFVTLTILRLRAIRQKMAWTAAWGRYLGVFVVAMLLGFLTTRPHLVSCYDATHTKANTLTPASQAILEKLDGKLTMTAYNNMLDTKNNHLTMPSFRVFDKYRFRLYWRFKPDIKLKYVYYYDTIDDPHLESQYPGLSAREKLKEVVKYWRADTNMFLRPEEIRQMIDLSSEGNRFLRIIERENGQKTVLRTFDDRYSIPSESEISAAMLRLAVEVPLVGFVQGHEGRDYTDPGERGYSRLSGDIRHRYALINNGFDVAGISLTQDVPEDVDILVIADLKSPLDSVEIANLKTYIAKGGDLIVAGDVKRQQKMNPITQILGVTFEEGQLVKPTPYATADLIVPAATGKAKEIAPAFFYEGMRVAMPGCVSLTYSLDAGYEVEPLFVCDSSWIEKGTVNFIDDTVRCDVEAGERMRAHVTAVALSREINGREQKIVVLGDADCLSNGEVGRRRTNILTRNASLIGGMFNWLSDGLAPLDVRRPMSQDNHVNMTIENARLWGIVLKWVFPAILLLAGMFIWIRRKGK